MATDDAARSLSQAPANAAFEAVATRLAEALPAPVDRAPWLGFFIGGKIYGFPLGQLREVARLTSLRRVPGAPAGVAGLVNLRGEIVCALDARAILGLPPRPTIDGTFFVAFRGFPDPLGVIVDAITDIYAIAPEEIDPPLEGWSPEHAALFVGTARVREGIIGLLDPQRIVGVTS